MVREEVRGKNSFVIIGTKGKFNGFDRSMVKAMSGSRETEGCS